VTGIAMVHTISGAPLGWLDGLAFDAPVEVASETGGGGDDVRLSFSTGEVAEAQVKKGLRGGKDLKAALARLADAIHSRKIAFVVAWLSIRPAAAPLPTRWRTILCASLTTPTQE
jgi:hypothetical protein